MKTLNHWFVGLDLSKMDDVLISYVHYLAEEMKPTTISFLHVVASDSISRELSSLFPELETDQDFEEIIREELTEKIEKKFNGSDIETRLIVKQGRPTDEIIGVIQGMDPDLLILGKKSGYQGEGILPQKIVKYVPCSILFAPETSRYSLDTILVPTDFSRQSAEAIKSARGMMQGKDGNVIAQHIFSYPAHFFPYMPSDKDHEKVERHFEKKKNNFIKEYEISDDIRFILNLLKKGKKAEEVYNATVRNQVDMIVLASKGDKKLSSLLREDFTDKLINYSFGIPLLIIKNKKKHQRYLKAFTE